MILPSSNMLHVLMSPDVPLQPRPDSQGVDEATQLDGNNSTWLAH